MKKYLQDIVHDMEEKQRVAFEQTLLPCPFCGSRPYDAGTGVIRRGGCSARTVSVHGKEEAAKDWNRRLTKGQ